MVSLITPLPNFKVCHKVHQVRISGSAEEKICSKATPTQEAAQQHLLSKYTLEFVVDTLRKTWLLLTGDLSL